MNISFTGLTMFMLLKHISNMKYDLTTDHPERTDSCLPLCCEEGGQSDQSHEKQETGQLKLKILVRWRRIDPESFATLKVDRKRLAVYCGNGYIVAGSATIIKDY